VRALHSGAYEGQATSDSVGYFTLDAGSAFDGPHLTATATDAAGNTSGFSQPTSGEQQGVDLQTGNTHPKTLIPTRSASQLAENYIGDQLGGLRTLIYTEGDAEHFLDYYGRTGYKWTRLSLDPLDWSEVAEDPNLYSQWEVDPLHDAFITELAERGTTIIYCLVFWDEEIDPDQPYGWTRFEDEAEVQRYLDYAHFVVGHFKGRIAYYEIFNESFYGGPGDFSQQNITLEAYTNLVYSATQVIREEDPAAKVIAGPAPAVYDQDCYDYELGILSSDLIMPVVDGVSWHPGPCRTLPNLTDSPAAISPRRFSGRRPTIPAPASRGTSTAKPFRPSTLGEAFWIIAAWACRRCWRGRPLRATCPKWTSSATWPICLPMPNLLRCRCKSRVH